MEKRERFTRRDGFRGPTMVLVRFQVREGETLESWQGAITKAADGPITRVELRDGGGKVYHVLVGTMDPVTFRYRLNLYKGRHRILIRQGDSPA